MPESHDLLRRGVVADSHSKLRCSLSQRAQSSRTEKPTHQSRIRPPRKRGRDPAPAAPGRHVELLLSCRCLSDPVVGQCRADSDCGTSSPASAIEKNAHRRFPRLMLPGQSEMNGPIVDSEAESDLRRIGVLRSFRSPLTGCVRHESDFRAIRDCTIGERVVDEPDCPQSHGFGGRNPDRKTVPDSRP